MTTQVLTINNLVQTNYGPCLPDLVLAERLGFKRPRVIRELIERNKDELQAYNPIAVRCGDYKGHRFNEYFLTEYQALLLCMFARTEKAAEVRAAIIKVFMAWRTQQEEAQTEPKAEPTSSTYNAPQPADQRWLNRMAHTEGMAAAVAARRQQALQVQRATPVSASCSPPVSALPVCYDLSYGPTIGHGQMRLGGKLHHFVTSLPMQGWFKALVLDCEGNIVLKTVKRCAEDDFGHNVQGRNYTLKTKDGSTGTFPGVLYRFVGHVVMTETIDTPKKELV